MNISFTSKQEEYISSLVKSGDFQNASEAVRDAIRLHQLYRQKVLDELRVEIEKGWDGPTSPRSVSDIIAARQKSRV
ncbi:MAG: type II toxin-antitoxin system ParD family antitoxin [Bacteroidota bacterium]